MLQIEVMYAKGWRKLRDAGPFLLRESAEGYALKYLSLRGRWRIVEVA